MAGEIKFLREEVKRLGGYVEEIDENLGEVESIMMRTHGGFHRHPHHHHHDCDCMDDQEGAGSGGCDCGCGEDDNFTDGVVELMCPFCKDKVFVEVECFIDGDVIVCPNCKNEFQGSTENISDSHSSCGCGCCGAVSENNTGSEEGSESEEE